MNWEVKFTKKAEKQAHQLNESVLLVLQVLVEDLEIKGPAPVKPGITMVNYMIKNIKIEDIVI